MILRRPRIRRIEIYLRKGRQVSSGPDKDRDCFAGNINDNFKIFKLLRQKEKDHKLIAFCLGLKGQSSRILSRKFGSQVTFAALEEGKESLAGQLTIDELAETYNLKRIDEETVILGIVGKDAEKTASVHFHNHLFRNKKSMRCLFHSRLMVKSQIWKVNLVVKPIRKN